MTIKEIIDGLKFTVDMFLFDPTTGETYKEPRNDMDKTTIDACNGAIELLEQSRWIPCSERLPEEFICDDGYVEPSEAVLVQLNNGSMETSRYWKGKTEPWIDLTYPITLSVVAWRSLPQSYKESEDKE